MKPLTQLCCESILSTPQSGTNALPSRMHGFDRVFNYFFLLGVSPFYIRSPQLIVSRSFSAAAVLKLIFGLAACLFTLYTGREFVFKPSRIDVSFLTMISAISTVAIDFLLLQILLLAKNETQATLLLELRAIERSMDVLLGPVTDQQRVFSTLKRTTREIILKSVILFSIPLIPCALFPELAYVLIICSFFIMFYSVLFQFMHNRLFLVYLNQSIDRYMIYIENDANPPLTSQIIVKCVRAFHGSIVTYNRTFRYQNMILAHCAFMVLLLFIYIATILGTKYDFSVSFLFLPGFILMGHDLGRLVWLCSVTASKLEQIKRVHSRQLEVAENATVGGRLN